MFWRSAWSNTELDVTGEAAPCRSCRRRRASAIRWDQVDTPLHWSWTWTRSSTTCAPCGTGPTAARVALRPHAKAHKCPEVARQGGKLGARGVSVQRIGEALPIRRGRHTRYPYQQRGCRRERSWDLLAARWAGQSQGERVRGSRGQRGGDRRAQWPPGNGARMDVLVELDVGQGQVRRGGADRGAGNWHRRIGKPAWVCASPARRPITVRCSTSARRAERASRRAGRPAARAQQCARVLARARLRLPDYHGLAARAAAEFDRRPGRRVSRNCGPGHSASSMDGPQEITNGRASCQSAVACSCSAR